MDLLTRDNALTTPKQVLLEMFDMQGGLKRCPKWLEKRINRVGDHLFNTGWRGRTLLDERMSVSSAIAVIKEAWAKVSSPEERQREFEQMLGKVNAARGIH